MNPNSNPTVDAILNPLSVTIIDTNKQRHFLAAFFFSFFLGLFGADRFYLGKIWTGILKFLTLGGFGVWATIDLSKIMSGAMRDKQGNEMLEYARYKKLAKNTVLICTLSIIALFIIVGSLVIFGLTQFMQSGGLDALITGTTSGSSDSQIQDLLNTLGY